MERFYRHRNKASNKGFTLVEVILSLFIFSLIASGAIAALRIGLVADEQNKRLDGELRQLQTMRALIKEDLAQIVPRVTRNRFGDYQAAPFVGGTLANTNNFNGNERYLMRFVRAGWKNPAFRDPRSQLQYVEYIARDDTLIRRTRPFIDAGDDRNSDKNNIERVMLGNITSLDVQFFTNFVRDEPQWIETWPADGGASFSAGESVEGGESAPPLMVEFLINTSQYGEINQRYWIGQLGDTS